MFAHIRICSLSLLQLQSRNERGLTQRHYLLGLSPLLWESTSIICCCSVEKSHKVCLLLDLCWSCFCSYSSPLVMQHGSRKGTERRIGLAGCCTIAQGGAGPNTRPLIHKQEDEECSANSPRFLAPTDHLLWHLVRFPVLPPKRHTATPC